MENDLISRSAMIKDIRFMQDLISSDSEWLHGYVSGLCATIDAVLDAPTVDAVPVERLGKIGKLFIPYSGCPRGRVGRMGEPATLAEEAMFWGVIVDEDGTRFVPVVEEVLHELIEKARAVDAVQVVRCKGCKHCFLDLSGRDYHICMKNGFLSRNRVQEDDFCSYGERRTDDD